MALSNSLTKNISANLPGYVALAVLVFLAVALVKRRFRIGYVLLHLAVALGERWQDARAKARLAHALAAYPESNLPPVDA